MEYNQAPKGFYFVKDKCTKLDGTVIKWFFGCAYGCADGNGTVPPCAGMVHYDPATVVDTDTPDCECGGLEYYKETCKTGQNNIYYYTYGSGPEDVGRGHEFVKKVCTTRQGKDVMSIVSCDTYGSCAGYKTCPAGTFVGVDDTCKCGGVTYGKTCMSECNYEETEETCTAAGKSFNQKCMGSSGIWFGECR